MLLENVLREQSCDSDLGHSEPAKAYSRQRETVLRRHYRDIIGKAIFYFSPSNGILEGLTSELSELWNYSFLYSTFLDKQELKG